MIFHDQPWSSRYVHLVLGQSNNAELWANQKATGYGPQDLAATPHKTCSL